MVVMKNGDSRRLLRAVRDAVDVVIWGVVLRACVFCWLLLQKLEKVLVAEGCS